MMGSDTITWPPEFSDFKRMDTVLKCGICYEYMTNCLITSCSHNFCSLCIRKFMQYKNQCPTCFENIFEPNLRNNRPLDEVILIYVKLRDKLLRALRLASVPVPVKDEPQPSVSPKTENAPPTPNAKQTVVKTEVKPKEGRTSGPTKTSEDDIILHGVKIPGIFNTPRVFPKPRKPGEFSLCPVCQVEVPAKNINMHLDSCLALDSEAKPKKAQPKRDPLPKRLYYMMPDKTLKKTLKDYGLNTQGDRKTMIARIQRYTVIYNAENDSPNPRPVLELIQQLEREEREEKPNSIMKAMQSTKVTVDRKADPETIEKANKAYCEENKESFKKLIEAMRAREGRNIKPLKPPSRVYSDDEDDPNRIPPEIADKKTDENEPSTSKMNAPSTSNENKSSDDASHSIYSQVTIYDSDSESEPDIFVYKNESKNEKKSEENKVHQIDWNKTKIDDGSDSENKTKEPNIDADTNLDASSCTLAAEEIDENGHKSIEENHKSLMEDEEHNVAVDEQQKEVEEHKVAVDEQQNQSDDEVSIIDDDSDSSINSIFNSSKFSDKNFTPTPKRITRATSKVRVSSTPNTRNKGKKIQENKNVNMAEAFDKCFEELEGENDENAAPADANDSFSSESLQMASEPDFTTPRRSKRKSTSDLKQNSYSEPRQTRRKKFKKDMSPAF